MAFTGGATYPRQKRPIITAPRLRGVRYPSLSLGQRSQQAAQNQQRQAAAQRIGNQQAQRQFVQANSNSAAPATAPPPAAPQPQLADPRDSRYYMELAAGQGGMHSQFAQLQAASKTEKAALGERLRLLGEQEPAERQGATNQANLQGLLYSGALGRRQGDIGLDFLRQRTDSQTTFDSAERQRGMEMDALTRAWGEGGTETWRLLQEAIERSSERDMNAPLTAPPAPSAPAPTRMVVVAPRKTGPGRPRRPARPARPSPRVRRRK